MNMVLILFLILCVLCAALLLFALVFGSRQDRYRSSMREEQDAEAKKHSADS